MRGGTIVDNNRIKLVLEHIGSKFFVERSEINIVLKGEYYYRHKELWQGVNRFFK